MEKKIELELDEMEILILRGGARFAQIVNEISDEEAVRVYISKILKATDEAVSGETRKEIGKLQRALRRLKNTVQYNQFIRSFEMLNILLNEEMQKEE